MEPNRRTTPSSQSAPVAPEQPSSSNSIFFQFLPPQSPGSTTLGPPSSKSPPPAFRGAPAASPKPTFALGEECSDIEAALAEASRIAAIHRASVDTAKQQWDRLAQRVTALQAELDVLHKLNGVEKTSTMREMVRWCSRYESSECGKKMALEELQSYQKVLEESLDTVKRAKDVKVSQMNETQRCKVCFERECEACFSECCHLCVCLQCASLLKECPVCRTPISPTRNHVMRVIKS